MKKLMLSFAMLAAFLIAGGVTAAECTKPKEVAMPDGATASTDEMVAGQTAVKDYMAEAQGYLDCLDTLEKANAETMTVEDKKAHIEDYNSVVGDMEAVAEAFNVQIRAYKAAQ